MTQGIKEAVLMAARKELSMNDYIKHIAAGILAAVIVALPAYLDSNNLFAGIWASLTAGAVAGVALFIVAMHFAKG